MMTAQTVQDSPDRSESASQTLPEVLQQAFSQKPFDHQQARSIMQAIIHEQFAPAPLGALLGALATRPPSSAELSGFAQALRSAMIPVALSPEQARCALDTCGTGGDGGKTFNISTAVALLVSACEVPVVKHGNRAVSSRSGSSDVLEALGLPVQQSAQEVEQALHQHHLGLCFAPAFHPALKSVAPIRRSLGVRTVFNLLGPLCNPAKVERQVLGVFSPQYTRIMAESLQALGSQAVMVVSALDGLDEISLSGPTQVSELRGGEILDYTLQPEDLGLQSADPQSVAGGSPDENARLIEAILNGQKQGAPREIVCLNAAAALKVAGRAQDLKAGLQQAYEVIDSGRAHAHLQSLRENKQGNKI